MIDELYKKLKKRSLESFVLQAMGVLCLFILHSRLANELSVEDYGVFSFALAIATMMVLLSTLGWPGVLTRLIPDYLSKKEWSLLKGALISSHFFAFLFSLSISAILLSASVYIIFPKKAEAFVIAATFLPLLSLIALRRRVFMALHNVRGSILPDEIILPMITTVALNMVPVSGAREASYLYIAIALLVFLVTLNWLSKLLPSELKQASPKYLTMEWFALAFPFLVGGGAQILLSQSGVLVLGYYNDMSGVGLYSAAFRLALFVTFVMTAINVIGMPLLASAFQSGDPYVLRIIFRKTQLWSICGAIPVGLVLFIFSGNWLELFGNNYIQAERVLQILIIGQVANTASGLSGSLLAVANKQKYYAISMGLTASASILLMAVCVPNWGVAAVAIIYSVCMVLLSIIQYLGAAKLLAI